MNRFNELINKKFDGEISHSENDELHRMVESDPRLKSEITAYNTLEDKLKMSRPVFEPNMSMRVMTAIKQKASDRAERYVIFGIIVLFVLSLTALAIYFFGKNDGELLIKLPKINIGFLSPVTDLFTKYAGYLNSNNLPESTYTLLIAGAAITFYLLYAYHREVKTLIVKK